MRFRIAGRDTKWLLGYNLGCGCSPLFLWALVEGEGDLFGPYLVGADLDQDVGSAGGYFGGD